MISLSPAPWSAPYEVREDGSDDFSPFKGGLVVSDRLFRYLRAKRRLLGFERALITLEQAFSPSVYAADLEHLEEMRLRYAELLLAVVTLELEMNLPVTSPLSPLVAVEL